MLSRWASLGAPSPFGLFPVALPLFLGHPRNCCEKGFFPLVLGQSGTRTGVERVASGHGPYLHFHLGGRNIRTAVDAGSYPR